MLKKDGIPGARVTLAMHRTQTVKPKTLQAILAQARLTVEDSSTDYYRNMRQAIREFTIILEPDPEGGFTVLVPALPGCITEGDTREEAITNAKEAILLYIEGLTADGEPIPEDYPEPELLKVAV